MCYCDTHYEVSYRLDNRLMRVTSNYDDFSGDAHGNVSYEFEVAGAELKGISFGVGADGSIDTTGYYTWSGGPPLDIAFGDSVPMGNVTMPATLGLSPPGAFGVERVYVVRDSGLVAFERGGRLWTRF